MEGVGPFKCKESDGRDGWMGEHLVCLADCTSRDKFPDEGGETRPPIIFRKEYNRSQVASMLPLEEAISSINQVMAGDLWYVEAVLDVEVAIIENPILGMGFIEEGEFLLHLVDCLEDQWIIERGVFDLVSKSHINSLDLLVEGIGGEELDIHIV